MQVMRSSKPPAQQAALEKSSSKPLAPLLKTASSKAAKNASSPLDDVVKELNKAVMSGSTANMKKALRPILTLATYGRYSAEDFYNAGAAHACVAALKKDFTLEGASVMLSIMCIKPLRESIFHVPDCKEVLARLALEEEDNALTVLWNLSDSQELAYAVATIPGLVPGLMRTMQRVPFNDAAESALSIIRNLTMFPDSQQELLKQPRIVDVLLNLTNQDETTTKATMAVANLVGKDEIKSELLRSAKHHALKSIVDILEEVLGGESTFALFEPLLSLRYLSLPQKNREILKDDLMPILPQTLRLAIDTNDAISAGHVIAILSQFAFDAETLANLKKDDAELLERLDMVKGKASNGGGDQEWRSVLHDVEGLIWTLRGGDQVESPQKGAIKQDQVMISYNWAHKSVALRVANFLRISGFRVWQDVENMKQNVMESMAKAVLESAAVIILVSPQYKESANCQREAMLSAKRNKKIIPLLVTEGYSGDGWLELFISPLLYYDISSGDFDLTMRQIVANELNAEMLQVKARRTSSSHAGITRKDVVTITDVAELIKSNPEIESLADEFVREEMDGKALSDMTQAWNGGKLSHSEVKEWFKVRSAGQLFQLKTFLFTFYGYQSS